MEPREKKPKRVAQGKRLAAYKRERFAWMKEERRKQEEEEEGLTTFREEEGKEEREEGKERSHATTNLFLLPAFAVVVVGFGVLWYLRKPEGKEKEEQPKPRPRILQRPDLERL